MKSFYDYIAGKRQISWETKRKDSLFVKETLILILIYYTTVFAQIYRLSKKRAFELKSFLGADYKFWIILNLNTRKSWIL